MAVISFTSARPLGESWRAWAALAIGVVAVSAHSASSLAYSVLKSKAARASSPALCPVAKMGEELQAVVSLTQDVT